MRHCCTLCVNLDAYPSANQDSRLNRRVAFSVIPTPVSAYGAGPEWKSMGGVWTPADTLDSSLRSE